MNEPSNTNQTLGFLVSMGACDQEFLIDVSGRMHKTEQDEEVLARQITRMVE